MKFDSSAAVDEVVWICRLADLPRGENRAVLQRLYNGEPPFSADKAEENNVEVNRNWLEGTNILSQARRQWNNAFLKQGNYYTVTLDSGPVHKRTEWSHSITRRINRELKQSKKMMEQERATGANVVLHGPGPTNFKDKRCPIPTPLPISSLMIPCETDIDFDNLEYFAVFREMTPFQLYQLTHGPRVDKGWNMPMVNSQLKRVASEVQKGPNATAYQYMPEKIEELIKQDAGGLWGSDAVPTIDTWDFYFRDSEDGNGWYRRVILDWGLEPGQKEKGSKSDINSDKNGFLYTSGKRKYANSLSEILQCNFGDCSAVAPFKYHSVRSLGWMLWGVCDLQNRLRCRFTESVFEQLMWFFRTANDQDFQRLKKAQFTHMGVIPNGISFVTPEQRFKPDVNIVELALEGNRQMMGQNSSAFTQDFDEGGKKREMTATETMARVNSVNAMVGGMLALAYEYERFKYMEISRRFCIKNRPYPEVARFRLGCLKDGVPEEMLDAERWQIEPERSLGAGNKTLELSIAQQLQQLRPNLSPDAQRRVDHIAIEIFTDQPDLAEELAPIQGIKQISASTHDAQLSSDRLLRGLPFTAPKDAVPEDYVLQWSQDLALEVNKVVQSGGMATQDQLVGFSNMSQHIRQFLQVMGSNPSEKEKVKEYGRLLGELENHIKAFAQRLQQQMQAAQQNGNGNGEDAKTAAALRGKMLIDQAKADNLRESHAQRTAQKQASFELEQQRKDQQTAAELRRESQRSGQELAHNRLKLLTTEPAKDKPTE